MSRFSSIEDVWGYLDSIPMFGNVGAAASNFGLENISEFCAGIGNPQNSFKSIHVAGTNGKGTVCWLFEEVYKSVGFRTGMFTSPHLHRYNERVRIGGEEISDDRILEFFREAESVLEEIPLTYFEISTALAFWAFSEEKVDIAIIETGLGGRLDSTNIINPELSVITSIGMDHEAILGNSLAKIAKEKAGIIKEGVPVVVGNLDPESMEVVEETAFSKNSGVIYAAERIPAWSKGKVQLEIPQFEVQTSFIEPVNAWNVAMVCEGLRVLSNQFPVSDSELQSAIEEFRGVPARFEKLLPDTNWYFSGSHNTQAIDAMMEGLEQFSNQKSVLVFTIMKDKVKREVLNRFKEFEEIYFYEMNSPRAAKREDIEPFLDFKNINENNYKTIFGELKTSLVICAGSFYFYPILKRWLIQLDKETA